MFLEKPSVFFIIILYRFLYSYILIFFYLYTFILEMLGKLLKSLWNSHYVVNIAWHASPLTTWRTRRSKFFFLMKGNLFSFMARISIPTVLLGHQYNCTKAVRIGKTNHHLCSTYSWEGLNFPARAKLGHIQWPSYVKGYSFLDDSLLGQRTYS